MTMVLGTLMWNRSYIIYLMFLGTTQLLAQDSSFTFKENDFVNIVSSPSLQPSSGMTIECWVNPELETYPDYAPLVHYFRLGGADQESGFALQYFQGELRFMNSVGTGAYDIYGDGLQLWPGITLEQNIWTHVAGTYDVTTGQAKIFKNGVEEASFNTEGGNINWDFIETVNMKIGKSEINPASSDAYFDGAIDEVRLWNVALDGATIQSDMCNSPLGGVGLLGYWNFNDGNDVTISDLTGNGNDGTLSVTGDGYWDADAYEDNPLCLGSGECVDSVIVSLPFFHSSTLEESMGDDWSFQNYPHGADYAYEITLSTQRNLYVDTCDPLTDFDTILAIKDECGNEVSLTEFDDGTEEFCPEASVSPPFFASIIDSITLAAGTYYIIVDGYEGLTGNYKVAVGTLPEIIGSDIASDDSYLEIQFSEGMYTEATTSGALEISDFEVTLDPNGGTATGVSISYLSNNLGGPLEGGEDTVRFAITVEGESTGQEQITVRPLTNASIFNSFGIGLLRSASVTQGLSDQFAPFLQSTLPEDGSIDIATNSNIVIDFSEPIRNNEGSTIDGSNASNSIALNNTDTGESIDYSISTSNDQSFIIDPDNDLPEFVSIQVILSNIQDTNGNALVSDTIAFQTADESPPLISSSGLASTNQYCYIDFSEGIFGTNSGTGGIEIEDLAHTFESNGGNCGSVTILEIKNYTGALLSGGESLIYAHVQLNGSPSGSETIMFAPTDGSSIFDQAGNPMHPSSITGTMTFNASAKIDSIFLPDSNEYLDVIFSNGIYGNSSQSETIEINDVELILNSNSGNASSVTITSLTTTSGNNLIGGESVVRFNLEFDTLPSGVETILLGPSGEDKIFNATGVLVPQSENTGAILLNDQLPPTGTTDAEDGAIDVNRTDTLSMTFTDNLYDPATGELMTVSELKTFITLEYADSTNQEIPFDLIMEGSPPSLLVIPQSDYASDGVVYFDFSATLADESGNTIEFDFSATFTIQDYIPPKVDTSMLAMDNSYIDLEFNDQIYGNDDVTGVMELEDILVTIIPNGSQMDACTVTSLTRTDSNFLTGGEISIRVNLEYNYTPNGNEFIILQSTEGVSIYDDAGNQFSELFYTDTTILNDILPPSVDSISIPIDSFIVLMESTPITFGFNEKVDSLNFSVTSKAIDSVEFDFTRQDSSLSITLQPPFASHDSITVDFSYLEDEAGLSTVDIAYTYITPILGDYDLDSKITHSDLGDLVENWEWKNFNYELGPVEGTVPHFISKPDSKFDIEDGMAFVQIWSWYQKEFGQIIEETDTVGKPLEMLQFGDELYLFIGDSIASGQIQFCYQNENSPLSFQKMLNDERSMSLNFHDLEKGYSLIEFARTGSLSRDTIKINLEKESEMLIHFSFNDQDRTEIQSGSFNFEHRPVPSEFKLYPAYPNPFNPVTTIRFDIPDSKVSEKINLSIFDIRGREIESLISGYRLPGSYDMRWNADGYSSGVYFVRLIRGRTVESQKIILLK